MVSENESVILLPQSLRRDTLLQKTGESGPDAQEQNDPQHRYDESQRQTARKHQYVNEQNVGDDRSEENQREWDVAINQEQDRRNDLETEISGPDNGRQRAPRRTGQPFRTAESWE
jgi:hypothetical protein